MIIIIVPPAAVMVGSNAVIDSVCEVAYDNGISTTRAVVGNSTDGVKSHTSAGDWLPLYDIDLPACPNTTKRVLRHRVNSGV